MRLKVIFLLSFFGLTLSLSGQIFGPKRSNIEMNLSEWKIILGDTVTLEWDVTINRKHLVITLNDSTVKHSGTLQIIPDTTVLYRLTAETEKGKKVSRTKKIKVLPPLINRLFMSDSIRYNHQDEIRWQTENAEIVTFNGNPVNTSGDTTLTILHDRPVTIKAINKNGQEATLSDTIKAWYIHHFEALGLPDRDTLIVQGGSEITLKWELDDVSGTTINGQPVNPRGSLSDTIKVDTLFILKAKRHDGTSLQKSVTFLKNTVNIQHLSLTNIFTKKAPWLRYGEPIRKYNPYKVRWSVSGVKNVTVNGVRRPASGILADQAMEEKDYTIRWNYYNQLGKIQQDSASISLVLQQRPLFSGNVRTETLTAKDTIYMEIISVDYDNYPPETVLKVIALDGQGNFVRGLADDKQRKKKNLFHSIIEKYEDKTHPIRNFSVKEHDGSETEYRPQNIMMVIDYSGSMDHSMQKLEPLIHRLIKEKHPLDTIRFVKFDETITAASPPSTEVDSLLKYFNEKGMEELSGYTALYAAADSAMNAMTANTFNERMILFTDGYENASFIYKNHLNTTAVGIIKRANEMDIPVHTVSLGGYVNEMVLKYLADYTSAHHYHVNNVEAVSQALREIFIANLHYYTISYQTGNNYDRDKTITLTYDGNTTGLNYSTKTAAKKPDLRKIAKNDLPPLPLDVENILNKRNLTPVAAPQNMVNFHFDKHRVREEYTHDIEQYIKVLNEDPATKAIIIGHTDMTGDSDYCLTLSKRRAQAASRKLIEAGISPDRLIILGLGQKHPLWPDDSEPAKAAENRRVEILVVE